MIWVKVPAVKSVVLAFGLRDQQRDHSQENGAKEGGEGLHGD